VIENKRQRSILPKEALKKAKWHNPLYALLICV